MSSYSQLALLFVRAYVYDLWRYLVCAGGVFAALSLLSTTIGHRKIQASAPTLRQIGREIAYSCSTIAIFGFVGVGMYLVYYFSGLELVYSQIDDFGLPYLFFTLVLIIVAHDAYFYWTHRLMHHKRLFRWFHITHHKSRAPTSWAAYAFDPTEAFVHAIFPPMFTFVFPVHWVVYTVFLLHMLIWNAVGHCGHEVFPHAFATNSLYRWNTTVTHHDLHHSQPKWNFGLYFRWWDRLMKTEHPNYDEAFHRNSQPLRTAGTREVAPGKRAFLSCESPKVDRI